MNEYVKRIDDNVLISDYKDGEILQHTDVNAMIDILKQGINANYEDIQKVTNGELTAGEASKLSGASLVKSTDGVLDDSDITIPTSNVVKKAIQDATPVKGEDYFTDDEVAQIVSAAVEAVVSDVNQRVEQNYIEKTEDFDTHVENKKIEIDTHTVSKKKELDVYTEGLIDDLEKYDISKFVSVQVVEEYPTVQEEDVLYVRVGA